MKSPMRTTRSLKSLSIDRSAVILAAIILAGLLTLFVVQVKSAGSQSLHADRPTDQVEEISNREAAVAEELPDQIADRQALAEYQAGVSGGVFGHPGSREVIVTQESPDQIADRQALAEYQTLLIALLFHQVSQLLTVEAFSLLLYLALLLQAELLPLA